MLQSATGDRARDICVIPGALLEMENSRLNVPDDAIEMKTGKLHPLIIPNHSCCDLYKYHSESSSGKSSSSLSLMDTEDGTCKTV